MLLSVIDWLTNNHTSDTIIFFANDSDAFRHIRKARTVTSPEVYFSSFLKWQKSIKPLWSSLVRLLAISKGLWLIANFLLYRLTSRCFIENKACLGFFTHILEGRTLILSGGGYLNSIWWLDELYAKAFPVIIAKLNKVPVILTGQGIGPFSHAMDRIIAKALFKSADIIGVRDGDKSKETINNIFPCNSKIIYTGDDALLMETEDPSHIESLLKIENIPAGITLVGVNLRDASSYSSTYEKPNINIYAGLLDTVVKNGDRHIVFIPISYNEGDDDRKSARQIVEAMQFQDRVTVIQNDYTPSELRGIIGKLNFAIGTSYHFLLFALSSNVPALGVYQNEYYKQKIEGLFPLYGMEKYYVDMNKDGHQYAQIKISDLFRNHVELSRHLTERNEKLQKLSREAYALLAQKIKENNGSR